MERVVIGRRSTHKITLEVDKCGSIIQWEFVSSQYDIAFGIYQLAEKQTRKKHNNELVCYRSLCHSLYPHLSPIAFQS